MNRTIGSYLTQSNQTNIVNLQVRRFRAHIIDVLFGGHSFAVVAPGYTGPTEVQADASIDFGTTNRPLVFVGNDVWVEMDNTGRWHATQYIATNRCVPVTSANVPNIPLPSYRPPLDTHTVFNIPRVDASFNPHSIAMAQLVPSSKMPPTIGTGSYDFVDGWESVASGATKTGLFGSSFRRFKVNGIAVGCDNVGFTLKVYYGYSNADIVLTRATDGTWTLNRYNGNTAALISTYTTASSTNFVRFFTGNDIITVSGALAKIKSQIVNGANTVTVWYALGGYTY